MAQTIKLGYSNSSGQTPNTLAGGELATNTSNRKIWVGNGSGNTLVFNHADYAPASANASQSWVSSNFSNNAGDITGVTAGTGMSGGGSSGSVTLNCTITDTNTWRGLGGTSSVGHRGDHGVTAYNHSQAAHAPSNANYITNNNQLTNGASYVTASVVNGYATTAYVLNQIDNLVDSAPGALNTLNELAAALGDDASYASTITSALAGKLSTTGGTIDSGGTSTTLLVRADNAGVAKVQIGHSTDGSQGTGVLELTQDGAYGGGISYNGDNSPAFASGETADWITFYGMVAGTRTEVFGYSYASTGAVTFNGALTWSGGGSGNANTAYTHSQAAHAPSNANYITNNNQLTNGAGYTTNVGDITGVTAGTGMSGGGSSGTVTLNCTITDTNTWRGLGSTSSTGHRGDHGVTAYNHSQAAHAPSNANYITNNNQLTNGAGYTTAVGDITNVIAGTGMSGGGSSGSVTLNCSIVNTWRGISDSVSTTNNGISASQTAVKTAYDRSWPNTWRDLGGTSSTAHRGDHGVTAYNHSQAAHAPSNANYITNNNQLTNGASYLTTSGKAADSNLLDGVDSGSFLRSDGDDTCYNHIAFNRCNQLNHDTIATATGSQGAFQVYNNGVGNDAFMTFHCGGDFACYFGLDADSNKLAVGGWSMGAVKYEIYHSGNKPSLSTLGFSGASNANYITNNNQLTNGAGYTTAVGDITNVIAGTGMTGGGSSGSVTLNCSITDTNTWRGLGGTSSTGHRGDHGVTAYNHSQAAHAPSNANYITNNNQLSNGAGYITSYTNTTYTAGTGMTLSGTQFNCSITDTNTWRAIGSTSSTSMRGDHGTTAYNHSQAAHAPSNANYITNNNQLTNGAGYTTNTGDITSVTAGTACTGGGTSGAVTINVTLGNNSASAHRGDHGATAYDHATHPVGATNGYSHIPQDGSGGQFLGYSSAGKAQWVSNPNTDTNTTYSASNGLFMSGTDVRHSGNGGQGSSNNSGQTFIQDITLDSYGHITGIATATASGGGGGGTTWNGMENISALSSLP